MRTGQLACSSAPGDFQRRVDGTRQAGTNSDALSAMGSRRRDVRARESECDTAWVPILRKAEEQLCGMGYLEAEGTGHGEHLGAGWMAESEPPWPSSAVMRQEPGP